VARLVAHLLTLVGVVTSHNPMPPFAEWQTFFAVQAGAAATLTGLVFVAVSINLGRIMETPHLPGRAVESLMQLLQVFFVAGAALIPGQSRAALAGEILAIGGVSWVIQAIPQIRYARSRAGHPLWWLVSRMVMSQVSTVPFLVAGILLALRVPQGLYWLVPGIAFSFFSGVTSAWILLVEILR
jgi:modulator of FtsH protease